MDSGDPLAMYTDRLHMALLSGLIILILVSSFIGLLTNQAAEQKSTLDSPELVQPVPNGSHLWPYTSKAQSFDERTLGINLIIRGDVHRTQRHLRRHTDDNWQAQPYPAEPVNGTVGIPPIDEPGIAWRTAHGSTRYAYFVQSDSTGEGTWMTESYQLYDGAYLGSRYHIRAYDSPDPSDQWTAIQAHKEYWDWFRLRHTVTSIEEAQQHVEEDLVDDPSIDSLRRVYLDNGDTSDGDGWATMVEFATVIFLSAILRSVREGGNILRDGIRDVFASQVDRRIIPQGLLFGGIILVTVGVRIAGVALEESLPAISPKIIAGVLYLVLVAGLPVCAGYYARKLPIVHAFLLTVVAFAAAILLDTMYLDISVLPIRVVLHRIALVLSLGLLAAGVSYYSHGGPRRNELVQIGAAGWIIGLLLPLVGMG